MEFRSSPERPAAAEAGDDTDPLSTFSETVALIYEAGLDARRAPQARLALQKLLDADEIAVVSAAREGEPRQPDIGGTAQARSEGHVLWVDIGEHEQGAARIRFRRNSAPFSDEDVRILSLLRRHLRTAHNLELLINHDLHGSLASTQLTQNMVKGLLVIDTECRIHWRNPAASAILASADGLGENNGRLYARRAFETARMEAIARQAAAGRHGVMLVASQSERHPYGLAFAPVKIRAGLSIAEPHNRSFVLVAIKEMRREIKLIAERLSELFGFTPAEKRLGTLLLDGYTLQDAAQLSEKALPTVKTQLRGMLKKTGAHSQAELMNVFLSLPSIF
jgi:DNA-binding CsgD family transcriptional regulator